MAETASRSSTVPAGLPIVSPKNAFVSGRAARRQASRSLGSTRSSSTDSFEKRCLSCVSEPPYSAREAITWSPGCSSVKKTAACAARPLANATAPAPPSRLAMRSSSTATVGLVILLYVFPYSCRLKYAAALSTSSKT